MCLDFFFIIIILVWGSDEYSVVFKSFLVIRWWLLCMVLVYFELFLDFSFFFFFPLSIYNISWVSIARVMGAAALQKYVGSLGGIGASGVGSSATYTPKELSKEIMPEKVIYLVHVKSLFLKLNIGFK